MTLPWQSEPLESLRARYPAALAEVCDVESALLGLVLRPGEQRRHVLDHPDGVRLIVSRDRLPGGRVWTHLSASLDAGRGAALRGRLEPLAPAERALALLAELVRCWREVSGSAAEVRLIGLSPGLVPHWEVLP